MDAAEGAAVYHCMSRTVNGERLIDNVAKEILRKQLWQIADYCGVQILTYAIMSNHFHVLVRIPKRTALTDAEIVRRYRVLYPKPTRFQTTRFEVIQSQLKSDGDEAKSWRHRQSEMMGDLSPFMKLVKQRFTVWYNRSHQRFGTLWAERFKSVLVEAKSGVLRTMGAYIDLNAVRAGLVDDPKDYRFCGYGEAVAGNQIAQKGLISFVNGRTWQAVQGAYRETLFGKGSAAVKQGARLSSEALAQVIKDHGQLPLATVLRCRIRYFSDGAVLGSQAFVQSQIGSWEQRMGRKRRITPREIPRIADWGDLTTLRGLRKQAFG